MDALRQQIPTNLQDAQQLFCSMNLVSSLKKLSREIQTKDQEIQNKNTHIKILEEKLKLAIAQRYVRSSEKFVFVPDNKTPHIQDRLFDEVELQQSDEDTENNASENIDETTAETIEVPAHTRTVRRGKRVQLPDYLPVVQVHHELSAEALTGPNGETFEKIGEVITKQLDIIPETVQVIEHVCFKYAVKDREELGIKIAPLPKQPIPKSVASAGLLAHVATAKYCYHLPLYRQEKIWESLDVHLPRNSLCRWMIEIGELVQPLIDDLMEEIKLHRHIHADETPVTLVNNKPTTNNPSDNSHQGYMWLYANHKGVVYDYQDSRGGEHPENRLSEFKGYLQTDAYAGYNATLSNKNIQSVGCFAHARRKFVDIKKSAGKKAKTPVVDHVLSLIGKLYHIESQAKKNELTEAEIYKERQTKAIPILKKLFDYLLTIKPRTPPNSLLGKAVAYSLNHWDALHRYTEDGCLCIDNNPAERLIKPFVIGRKNWLFCGNIRGAKAAANLYSLIESAKLYNLKVFDYLKFVFEKIPTADTPRKLEQLLPQYAKDVVPKIKDFSQPILPSANEN